jgi:cytochrome b561
VLPPGNALLRLAANASHVAMYAFMVVMPVSGVLMGYYGGAVSVGTVARRRIAHRSDRRRSPHAAAVGCGRRLSDPAKRSLALSTGFAVLLLQVPRRAERRSRPASGWERVQGLRAPSRPLPSPCALAQLTGD